MPRGVRKMAVRKREDATRILGDVTGEKNDFSNWVRDVFGDVRLANELSRSRNRADAARILNQRVSWLKKKLH